MSLKPKIGSKQRSREKCKARTKAGGPCQAPAVERGLCFFHAHPEKLAALGRLGGQKNRRWRVNDCDLPTIRLRSIDDLIILVEETINRLRQGPFNPDTANTIGDLSGILLKLLEQRGEDPDRRATSMVYTSLFYRQEPSGPTAKITAPKAETPTAQAPGTPADVEEAEEEEGADLYPQPERKKAPAVPPDAPLPAFGEAIDEPPDDLRRDKNPRRRTIEL